MRQLWRIILYNRWQRHDDDHDRHVHRFKRGCQPADVVFPILQYMDNRREWKMPVRIAIRLVIAPGFIMHRRVNVGPVCVLTYGMHRRGSPHPVLCFLVVGLGERVKPSLVLALIFHLIEKAGRGREGERGEGTAEGEGTFTRTQLPCGLARHYPN